MSHNLDLQIPVIPSANISIDVTMGNFAIWTATQNENLTTIGNQYPNQELTLYISSDNTPRLISFNSSSFVVSNVGSVLIAPSKLGIIEFKSNGVKFYEMNRALL